MTEREYLKDLNARWNKIQQGMKKEYADGCLLSIDVNLFYTTGMVYSGYCYLPATGLPLFFVKRPEGWKGENFFQIRKPEQILELFAVNGIPKPSKLLLEADELSYNEYKRLKDIFQPEEVGNASALLRQVRMIKTEAEIAQFRLSAEKHVKTYKAIKKLFQPGMTDLDLQWKIEGEMRKNGSIGIFRTYGKNMELFMGSVLAGDNANTPSPFDFALGGGGMNPTTPIGANGTPLKEGTTIMVDMAGNYTPYITDITRVFAVGKLPEEACRAHQVALTIQHEMEAIARPGVPCAELYHIAFNIAEKEGFGPNFMGMKQQAKFVGHGIGLQINELPVLAPRSKDLLQKNMVFAYEPKFVFPGVGAVGVENSYLVTDDSVEKLTLLEEEIIQLL